MTCNLWTLVARVYPVSKNCVKETPTLFETLQVRRSALLVKIVLEDISEINAIKNIEQQTLRGVLDVA